MKNHENYLLSQLFLMQLSLILPLIMLDAPMLLILAVPLLVFSPLLFNSTPYATIVFCAYDIIRPILYIWALVVTIGGKQDFFAIAFYIIAALQIMSIAKRFIGTIGLIVIALTEEK